MQLGVGLLEKGGPELFLGVGLHEDKLPVPEILEHHYNLRKFVVDDDCFRGIAPCWKAVINDDINPLAILPESGGVERLGRIHKAQCVLSTIKKKYDIFLFNCLFDMCYVYVKSY